MTLAESTINNKKKDIEESKNITITTASKTFEKTMISALRHKVQHQSAKANLLQEALSMQKNTFNQKLKGTNTIVCI